MKAALLALLFIATSAAFRGPNGRAFTRTGPIAHAPQRGIKRRSKSELKCALLPSTVTNVASRLSPPVRNSLILGAAAVAVYKNRRVLYPGSAPDPDFSEPLPEGSLGCPLIGNLSYFAKMGDSASGAGLFFRWRAAKYRNPRIWKYNMMGKPTVVLSGMKALKQVFNDEFNGVKTGIISKGFTKLFGGESLLFVDDAGRHKYLRRLVGSAITPEAVQAAMPMLIKSATEQLDKIKVDEPVEMEKILTSYTLDVAWRVILGLDLQQDEVPTFYDAVDAWIGGVVDPRVTMLPGMEKTKAGKALSYLVSKIERKLDSLEENGPDGSTMSGMYFARDEEDPSKRLTRDEIISNSLLLILAGSETAASTLTVASLALGLHTDAFEKLRTEQAAMLERHPNGEMTRSMLDRECPWLDAVIKETMRIKPLASGGAIRFAQETLVVEGKQIPKGYGVVFNPYLTHSRDPAVREENGMDIVEAFKPERWLNEETKPTEYMPWGIGPRFCLGYNLAQAEMKVFLALFARKVASYEMVAGELVEWKRLSIIPKPKDGALIRVTSF